MNSAQEAKQELQAAIRYCENAISAANSTIESLDFRQELAKQQAMSKQKSTGREDALEREVSRLKDINKERQAMIDQAKEDRAALTKQVEELTQANMNVVCDNDDLKDKVQELESKVQGQYDDIVLLQRDVEFYTKEYNSLLKEKQASSGPCGCQAYRDLEEKVATMPLIPRDVAIAIFREGIKQGVSDACDALSDEYVQVDETETFGDFEVSFQRDIKLGDDLDLDWIRDKVGSYETKSVEANLKGLLENLNFKNRIDGIDKV